MLRVIFAVFLTTLVLIDTSCKKGDNDPAFSLRTRKQRLSGRWSILSGNASLTIKSPGVMPDVRNFTFSEGKGFLTFSYSPDAYYLTYLLNLEFDKEGNFKLSENFNGVTLAANGSWNFTGRIGDDQKNKEEIYMKLKDVISGDTDEHLFNCLVTNFAYKIKELRNDKMVIYTYTDAYINSIGERAVFQGEYTMVKN